MSKLRILGCVCLLLVIPVMAMAQKQSKNMVPVLNAISPDNAIAGGADFTLTVTGSNFTSGSSVQWNGSSLSTTAVSSTELHVNVAGALIASEGTAQVTVYTAGRWGGTSNALTFTINPAPAGSTTTTTSTTPTSSPTSTTTTTTSTSALEISTASVPGGTQDTDYSTDLAASGGTPAYTWGLVTSAGALPPGLSLGADGKITGKPTQSGTFPFTAQASDQAGQAVQKQFSLTVAATTTATPTSTNNPIFRDDLESGTFANWYPPNLWSTLNPQISNTFAHSGADSYVQHYYICGDSTNAACGASTQDMNRYIIKILDAGLDHFFVRAYMYQKHPEVGAAGDGVMRKIIWIADGATANWSLVCRADGASGVMNLLCGNQGNNMSQTNAFCATCPIAPNTTLNYDTWYSLELEVQLNTPNTSDGIVRLWVNGTLAAENTAYAVRGPWSSSATFFSFGRQAQRWNYALIDEYRYWDDIVISSSYIGP